MPEPKPTEIPEPDLTVLSDEDLLPLSDQVDVSDLVISVRPVDGAGQVVVAPEGDLDINAADRVRVALIGAVRTRGCRRLRVDLSGVDFIDSTGLGALVAGRQAADAAGVAFLVTDPSPQVRRALLVTRLDAALGLAPVVPAPRSPEG
jgi:anti-sigma B factor antagonist